MRTTKAMREREDAAASAGSGRRITREMVEGTIRTVSANARTWEAAGFPVSAERAWGIVEREKAILAEMDRKAQRVSEQPASVEVTPAAA